MTWLDFAIGSLATFRLALLVSREAGPAFIFRKLRRLPDKGTATKQGLECPACVSVYASALVTTFYWWVGLVPGAWWPVYWLAFSAAATCIHMRFTKEI